MTQVHAFTVVLDSDIDQERATAIADALRMVRCVAVVEPHEVTSETAVARMLARSEMAAAVHQAVQRVLGP